MKGGDVALLKCLMRSRLSASIFRATEPVPREENFNFVLPNIGDVPFHPGSEFNFPKTLSGKWKRCCQYQCSGLKHFLGFILGNSLTVTLRYQSNVRTSISLQIQINTQQPSIVIHTVLLFTFLLEKLD